MGHGAVAALCVVLLRFPQLTNSIIWRNWGCFSCGNFIESDPNCDDPYTQPNNHKVHLVEFASDLKSKSDRSNACAKLILRQGDKGTPYAVRFYGNTVEIYKDLSDTLENKTSNASIVFFEKCYTNMCNAASCLNVFMWVITTPIIGIVST